MVDFDESTQNKRLEEMRKNEEEDVSRILAGRYGYNYLDLSALPINSDAIRILNEEEARASNTAIFDMVGKKIQVAILSPNDEKTIGLLSRLSSDGYITVVHMVSRKSLEKAWSRYKDLSYSSESTAGTFDIATDNVIALMEKVKHIADIEKLTSDLLGVKQTYRISKIMEIMLAGALALGASDVHLEPEEIDVRMRFRIDGVLLDAFRFDKNTYALILSRIKLLSGLKLNVKDMAQDGRFSIKIKDNNIEIRTSILPGAYDESVVMRLLNPKTIAVSLEQLGIEKRTLDILIEQINKPNGMLLITGPTGSGKTTTLYAFLKKIYSPDIKIITIEDPIEYHLKGVSQTQVSPEKGYTFADGLRSIVRQDPDVILVGEIRDLETSKIALQAALTGHLVLSTLHTNDAAGTIPRLVDLGVDVSSIASGLKMAVAQRLVRKVCKKCSVPAKPTEKEIAEIKKGLKTLPKEVKIPDLEKIHIVHPKEGGCQACNFTGYKGRQGLFEAFLVDTEMEKFILTNPPVSSIRELAIKKGMITMYQSGLIDITLGITTFDEVARVVEEDDEKASAEAAEKTKILEGAK